MSCTAFPQVSPTSTFSRKTEDASDGLLLVTPHYVPATVVGYVAIVDNNGVPRFRRYQVGENFRRHADGPLIDGKRVRYSISLRDSASLLDEQFEVIGSVQVVAPLTSTDYHDFLITDEGNYLFISYQRATRDLCAGEATPCPANVLDSVIQEVTPTGIEVFRWNSWDHLKLADCQPPGDYATPQFAVSGRKRHHRFVPALLAGVAHRPPVGSGGLADGRQHATAQP